MENIANMKQSTLLAALAFTVLFTFVFHQESAGINFLIFEVVLIVFLLISRRISFNGFLTILAIGSTLFTSIAVTLFASGFAIAMNIISLILLSGIVVYPKVKSIIFGFGFSFVNMLYAQREFFNTFSGNSARNPKTSRLLRRTRIFLIPTAIILLFLIIYRRSNPLFDDFVGGSIRYVTDYIWQLIKDLDFSILFTLIAGLLVANTFVYQHIESNILETNNKVSDQLARQRRKKTSGFKLPDLNNENKAGIFLLAMLNSILLIVNIIDIHWVWFNFEWDGQYLKQFVHEGTYLLIVSIFISIFLVLFFFRENLNFYPKNQYLKYLSYVWLGQNAILAISVAMRNFWYINYFNLAYKRLGVAIFLIMTVYGILSVICKVRNKKSAFYLFKTNALAVFLILVISSFVNWDAYIVRYNFEHAKTAFVHLDYLSTLSDKTLPELYKSIEELRRIDTIQKENFPFDETFMTPETYKEKIAQRKAAFMAKWEHKGVLSWNWAEYKAYRAILEHD